MSFFTELSLKLLDCRFGSQFPMTLISFSSPRELFCMFYFFLRKPSKLGQHKRCIIEAHCSLLSFNWLSISVFIFSWVLESESEFPLNLFIHHIDIHMIQFFITFSTTATNVLWWLSKSWALNADLIKINFDKFLKNSIKNVWAIVFWKKSAINSKDINFPSFFTQNSKEASQL